MKTIKQLQKQKAEIEKQIVELERNQTLIIKELGIEVKKELRLEVKFKDIKIPKGWRLLTFQEAVYIFDNLYKEVPIGEETEWIEHYSKKMEEKGYASALGSSWDVGRLSVYGDGYGNYGSGGYAFGVRFCRELSKKGADNKSYPN